MIGMSTRMLLMYTNLKVNTDWKNGENVFINQTNQSSRKKRNSIETKTLDIREIEWVVEF